MRPLTYILNCHKINSAAYRKAVKAVTTHHCGPSNLDRAIQSYYGGRKDARNPISK